MSTDHRAALASITRLDQLIAYLRDEMGWPISQNSFEEADDLFFDFTPEELGIDPRTAAKIESIKRLRPLSPRQPWGIFFVEFEPKRLPVVALRRLLGQVALKKRASANKAERAAWAVDDLLFISNFGAGDQRQISFAHFSQDHRDDMPTLRVLGWDNLDTSLHLDHLAKELTEELAWPDDESDVAAWRQRWGGAFKVRHGEVVATSKELALRLAEVAVAIRDRIKSILAIETERGPLSALLKAFRAAMVHDLDADRFADMYAQTVTYGLLSARIADPQKKTADDFLAHMRTNPFLRELMETFLQAGGRHGKAGGPGIDFDELGVSEVVELLDRAKMDAVIRDFGDRDRQDDPVIYFYELFLSAYDKRLKVQRGVFYTPQPVVSFIVRSVHALLKSEFGLADGLADTTTWGEMARRHPGLSLPPLTGRPDEAAPGPDEPFVQILDPATGTGTFLVEVIDVIHRTLMARWKAEGLTRAQQLEAWNDYVPMHLLRRLHAYELMMAPYAIAHMRVGLKLTETGYRFATEERARIYLTNALEPWVKQQSLVGFDALSHEANAVSDIKRQKRFTVVIGNPPYSNFGQLNRNPTILHLLQDYKRGLGERKLNLDDDYIKFIRFSQYLIGAASAGVVGMITNNAYLDGVTHRVMRQSLLSTFDRLAIANLHGDSRGHELNPFGGPDDNVFDIQQGVSVMVLARLPIRSAPPAASYQDFWGQRAHKYRELSVSTIPASAGLALRPAAPRWMLVPELAPHRAEYEEMISVSEIFPERNTGIESKRDSLTVRFTEPELAECLDDLRHLNDRELRDKYHLPPDGRDWSVGWARADISHADRSRLSLAAQVAYRPFDVRWTAFTGVTKGFLAYPRTKTMLHFLAESENIGLIATRINRGVSTGYVFCTRSICDRHFLDSAGDSTSVFPLYLYHRGEGLFANEPGGERIANLKAETAQEICNASGLRLRPDGRGDLVTDAGPEDLFGYAYAILHSAGYRARYAGFLKADFPRVPRTSNKVLFRALAQIGGQLTAVHLLESPMTGQPMGKFFGSRDSEVSGVGWSSATVWVNRAHEAGFASVPEAVWNFHIGGYQVCRKWLKDRKGRTLSDDDIAHYQRIVVAISETIRTMGEIDEVIDAHGGWPGAFSAGPTSIPVASKPLRRVAESSRALDD